MGNKPNNLVIAIYFHPEAYPPTLNAVSELSECFDHITIVHRPHLHSTWQYPPNVRAMASGSFISSREQESASLGKKISYFISYVSMFFRQCIRAKPQVILVYDSLSLHAYHLIKRLLPFEHKVWYHNHDVTEPELLRKFSIGWFAAKTEVNAFTYLDVFSLPANDRLKYFPMQQFKGRYFFIPNYPAKRFYTQFYHTRTLEQTVRIIFQGQVGPYHGIEEIIPLLQEKLMGFRLELVLKGPCKEDYKNNVLRQAEAHHVTPSISFIGVTPYAEVPVASAACHIGVGILARNDIMNTTLGTASNKLYEYAAVGLPVIYYNSDNFTRFLGKYRWAIAADLTTESIKAAIVHIISLYDALSADAHQNFIHELNYEQGFAPVKKYLFNKEKV